MSIAYESLTKQNEWLYKTKYKDLDYNAAYQWMHNRYLRPVGCSAVLKGHLFGKNLDWTYDECVEFVVKTKGKYEAISVAGGLPMFDRAFMNSGAYSDNYKYLPFMVNDGINERGVLVALNVVPIGDKVNGIDYVETTGTNPSSSEEAICAMMLPRYILDSFGSADNAMDRLENLNIYCPHTDNLQEELHLMVGDKNACYIVEFVGNKTKIIKIDDHKWMTNYYRYGAKFDKNGHLIIDSLSNHATGTKRSDIIADNYKSIKTVDDMVDLMRNKLKFTNAYTQRIVDEFTGDYSGTVYGDLTIKDAYEHPEKFEELINGQVSKFNSRSRIKGESNYGTWQTTHSAVYDINDFKLYLTVQEDTTNTYEFIKENYETKHKNYIFKDGKMFCAKEEMDSDIERLAINNDGSPFEDGTECTIYKKDSFAEGSDTVFCIEGHWYDY